MRMARNFAGIGALGGLFILAGCSDPIPPAAQAGISIHLQEYDNMDPVHGMDKCPPGRHWANVPADRTRASGSQQQQTSMDDSRATAVNNQDGNTVGCAVTPNGNGFKIVGDATGYATDDSKNPPDKRKPTSIHIRIGKIGDGEDNARGTLSVQDDASLNPYFSEECTYSVSGGSLGVKAGSIWGRVTCENLADKSSPGAACYVDTGYFLLENCSQ